MNQRNIIIIAAAVVLGLLAVYLANVWFTGVSEQQEELTEQQEIVQIAVASQDLEFGAALNNDNIRMTAWPASSVPEGAFTEPQVLMNGQVAIRPITRGEPILQSRISGRASLSANLPLDMRAVSIPVNEVSGVAGFVLPGDVVDVMLTHDSVTTVLLENILVLAIDRRSNEQETEPAVVTTATLQVDPYSAQKLTLARQVGDLTLALRNVENQEVGPTRRLNLRDIGVYQTASSGGGAARPTAAAPAANAPPAQLARRASNGPQMQIIRGTDATTYEVQRYGSR